MSYYDGSVFFQLMLWKLVAWVIGLCLLGFVAGLRVANSWSGAKNSN